MTMPKIVKEHKARQGVKGSCANSSLDKLAQLRKRGRAKYVQTPLIQALIKYAETKKGGEAQRWVKHFCRIETCSSVIKSDGTKATAKYCNSRACRICSAIRTGKLWNKYETSLKRLKEPFFVTLTQGSRVGAMELKQTIAKMQKAFKRTMEVMRKRNRSLVGFRKLEITYETSGKHKDTYHPHFHVVVDGEEQAYWLISEWLNHNPKASEKAQDVRRWDSNKDLNEIFKYFAIFFDKKGNPIPVSAMYNLVVVMDGIRSFQTFGNFAKGIQEAEDVNEGLISQTCEVRKGTYEFIHDNWWGTVAVGDGSSPGTFVPLIDNLTTERMQEHYNKLTQWLNV